MALTPLELLGSCWDGSLPIRPMIIADKLGIDVVHKFGMPDLTSGKIQLLETGVYRITYDATEPPLRQRFFLAHALGHYALEHLTDQQRCFVDQPANFMTDVKIEQERQANSFAMELLAPSVVLKCVIEKKGVETISALANVFHVSKSVVIQQLNSLGITQGIA